MEVDQPISRDAPPQRLLGVAMRCSFTPDFTPPPRPLAGATQAIDVAHVF
jgi:hypothetical protein